MGGPDRLYDKAVLAGDESATIPRIDSLALHLAFLTVTIKSLIFSTDVGTFFSFFI
jgi:hypothetical protein